MEAKSKKVSLYNFLEGCRVGKGEDFTHTSIFDPAGSFYITPEKYDDFIKLYKETLLCNKDVHMTERHRDIGPILIDLDFRFALSDGDADEQCKRRYTIDDVMNILRIYANELKEYFVVPENNIKFYVMEKDLPVVEHGKGVLKDGIHIMVPGIVTKPNFQFMLRKKILNSIEESLAHLRLSNKIADVVDEAVIERNNWQMYGSRKPNCQAYRVSHIFNFDTCSATFTEENVSLDDTGYIEELSIRNKFVASTIKTEKLEDVMQYEQEISRQKMQKHFKNAVISKTKNMQFVVNEEEYEQAKKYVALLRAERADSYNDWIRVGWCLRNIDHRLVNEFDQFSKLSAKYKEGECEKLWNYMRHDGACLKMGTLRMWAKEDDPERYQTLIQTELGTLIRATYPNKTEYDVARVVQKMFGHQFAYDSKTKTWYQFRNHRWYRDEGGLTLKHKFPTAVADVFRKTASTIMAQSSTEEDASEKEKLDNFAKGLLDIVTKLKKSDFQGKLKTECEMMFCNDKFEELLDGNTHLIGFENGVYDLNALEFREGRPEDFLSLTTGNNYVEYDNDNPMIKEIDDCMKKILTSDSVREYVYRLLASFLHGAIREERFHIWTGVGCHAKGTMIMMADGTSKKVEDIQVGEQLMGDDSTPRNVQQLFRGKSDMYRIVPAKGEPFVVNGEHVLSLKTTNMTFAFHSKRNDCWEVRWAEYDMDKVIISKSRRFNTEDEAMKFREGVVKSKNTVQPKDVIDITVNKYLEMRKRIGTNTFNLYRCPTHFEEKPVPIDPYFMGYWLGDGGSCHSCFTTADKEVVDYVQDVYGEICDIHPIQDNSKAKTYSICNKGKNPDFSCFATMRKMGVLNNKHIPNDYRFNSREVRMQLLAGIIDSDGHYQKGANQFEVTFKSERLMDDVIALARSLGFACYKYNKKATWTHKGEKKSGRYFRTHIVGDGIEEIPTKLARKKAQPRKKTKDVSLVGFKVERVDDDNFYGFELDGNHRYMMDDFIVGHNSNGKSKLLELYQSAFGEYCVTLPITLLTQKRAASNSACPELARAKAKRFACLQEPSENEKLNIGLMKELSGGDKIFARSLYSTGGEFKPQFKMILTCNHLPHVPSDDGGTWRRIRVVEFKSKFCDSPDPNNPNEFPIDTELSQRFEDWKETFMGLLIEYYKRNVTHRIKEPEEVMQYTRNYQRTNDIIADFLDNRVVKDEEGFLGIPDAFFEFRQFLKDENDGRSMRKSDFIAGIERQFSVKASMRQKIKGFKGYRLKSSMPDTKEDEEDALD